MGWFNKIFSHNRHEENLHFSREEEMLEKIKLSINQCEQEIKKATEEIEQMKKWSTEAILEVFYVPNSLWYKELTNYTEIKNHDENKTVDSKVVSKCEEVLAGYSEQIKLRESKIVLYKTLIEKYDRNKVKMEQIKKKSDDEARAQLKLRALEKHSQRIDQLRNSPENIDKPLEGSNQLEILESQASEVIQEFEISEEVKNSLEKISQEFIAGKYSLSSKPAIEEIEKLVEKIKKQ